MQRGGYRPYGLHQICDCDSRADAQTVLLIVDLAQILCVADKGYRPEVLHFFRHPEPHIGAACDEGGFWISGIPLGQFIGGARAKNIIAALKGRGLWPFSHPRGHRGVSCGLSRANDGRVACAST